MEFSRFNCHYLFHDRDEATTGFAGKLETIILNRAEKAGCTVPLVKRPQLPYCFNEDGSAEDAYRWLRTYLLPELIKFQNAVVFGVGLGGMLAAKLQEDYAKNLSVVAINAPLTEGAVGLSGRLTSNRVAIYSKEYKPISDSCNMWPLVAGQAYDVAWLQHGAHLHQYGLGYLLTAYMKSENLAPEVASFSLPPEVQGAAAGL